MERTSNSTPFLVGPRLPVYSSLPIPCMHACMHSHTCFCALPHSLIRSPLLLLNHVSRQGAEFAAAAKGSCLPSKSFVADEPALSLKCFCCSFQHTRAHTRTHTHAHAHARTRASFFWVGLFCCQHLLTNTHTHTCMHACMHARAQWPSLRCSHCIIRRAGRVGRPPRIRDP